MVSFKFGYTAEFLRIVLFIINIIFIMLGLVVFLTAAILHWGSTSFSKLTRMPDIDHLVSSLHSVKHVTIVLLF
jgi:hypothetical protein